MNNQLEEKLGEAVKPSCVNMGPNIYVYFAPQSAQAALYIDKDNKMAPHITEEQKRYLNDQQIAKLRQLIEPKIGVHFAGKDIFDRATQTWLFANLWNYLEWNHVTLDERQAISVFKSLANVVFQCNSCGILEVY